MMSSLLFIIHVIGLALSLGAATVKIFLLLKCRSEVDFVPVYTRVAPIITRQIVTGLILLTLTGIGWLLLGYEFSPALILKIVMVGAIWVLGPIIDNAVEPKFFRLAPAPGQGATALFLAARNQYLTLEMVATGLFYAVIVLWLLR